MRTIYEAWIQEDTYKGGNRTNRERYEEVRREIEFSTFHLSHPASH